MFSSLATLRTTLVKRLERHLPRYDWRLVDHIEGYRESLVPVVIFEFNEFSGSAGGQPLDRDTVAASVDINIVTPHTDYDGVAEDDLDESVLRIVRAIVKSDDLFFSTARKEQLKDGPMMWRVSLTALTNIGSPEGK